MSATCRRCGAAAIELLTGLACDACDPKSFAAPPVAHGPVSAAGGVGPAEAQAGALTSGVGCAYAFAYEHWSDAPVQAANTAAAPREAASAAPSCRMLRMQSIACPLCGNPAAVPAVTGPDGVQLLITVCPCVPPTTIVFAHLSCAHPGWNGVAHLGDEPKGDE